MNRLVGDLVDIACIEAGVLAVVREVGDPTHIVTQAVDTFQAQASANGVSLVAEIVRAPLAAFDPARILQVLTNLLTNAIKFTPTIGRVVVQVGPDGGEIRPGTAGSRDPASLGMISQRRCSCPACAPDR